MHFCPHPACDYRGWLGLNNLRANGHPSSGPWRQLHCLGCNGFFPEHHGTIFHGKQAAVELIVRVLACLAEGLGIRATARVLRSIPYGPALAGGRRRAAQAFQDNALRRTMALLSILHGLAVASGQS
jgi:hypothetical protein